MPSPRARSENMDEITETSPSALPLTKRVKRVKTGCITCRYAGSKETSTPVLGRKLMVLKNSTCQVRREEARMRKVLEHWSEMRWLQ